MIDIEFRLGEFEEAVEARLRAWAEEGAAGRLWDRDTTLWSDEPDPPELADRLGWLDLPARMEGLVSDLAGLAAGIPPWITDLVLLGMGGSSLAPEVFARTAAAGGLPLTVIDTTHPRTIRDMEWITPANTVFIVASKSGTTIETLSLFRHFWSRVGEVSDRPGDHFLAITDPGSPLETLGRERDFMAVVQAPPDVGGRFSALGPFGLVPAALMGIDLARMAVATEEIVNACREEGADNPGLRLGASLAALAELGRDKATFVTSQHYEAVPDWTEQLIAESTGKGGRGIVPVAHEPPLDPDEYGDDRLFIGLIAPASVVAEAEQWGEEDDSHRRLDALEAAGHPVVRVEVDGEDDLAGLFFVWEFAVAMAGSALGIHPFNQPDVQLAKKLARRAMSGDEEGEEAIEEAEPDLDLAWDVPPYGHAGSRDAGVDVDALTARVDRFFDGLEAGRDYVGIHAYLPGGDPAELEALAELREAIAARAGVATTLGYGPRFLHSTGQLHKGGPDSGAFLQLVDDAGVHVHVPETDFTFHQLIRAQAAGDLEALEQRERRALRVRVGPPGEGIARLIRLILRDD